MWDNTADYTYQWWAAGLRAPDKVFHIQTSRYGLAFDFHQFRLTRFGPIESPPSEEEALHQDNRLIESLPEVAFAAALEHQGQSYPVESAGRTYEDCHLIESGKYLQRRWLTYLTFAQGAPPVHVRESGLELCAWPDRIAFILRVTATQPIAGGALQLVFTLPPGYTSFSDGGDAGSFAGEDGEGLAVLGAFAQTALHFDPDTRTCTARVEIDDWPAGEERAVGVIVYPAPDVPAQLSRIVSQEAHPVRVRAVQVAPEAHELEVAYRREFGWHAIALRNDGATGEYAEAGNHRIERVNVTVENPGPSPHTVRLNFAKDGRVFGITGVSAILRDAEGHPLGVPVQLSKNWHAGGTQGSTAGQSQRFEGQWFHGLVMLTIPARETVHFEYTSVNALWGALPAASHAQLCLVGWGGNQLWNQAAIGAWGENLCFQPEHPEGSFVTDTRPLMVWGMGDAPQKPWAWTHNVGGADFLVYYDPDVEPQSHSRIKTRYRRHGPNLTEVTYAGTSFDRKVDLAYTVSLYRTDDITRGLYRIRYDVVEKVAFTKLVLFQCGSYVYNYTKERKFAYGNAAGLIREWDAQWGGFTYRTDRLELTGEAPWISMHEAERWTEDAGAWANRGLVVRHWDAKLGGKRAAAWVAEIGVPVHGRDTSLVDFLPPPGVTELLPGDYVEAEIVHVVMPQHAADYYGPNENLRQALAAHANTWRMIHREAAGNHLDVKVTRGGTLEHRYPVRIRSRGGEVAFTVTGGVGYVPATIAGLVDYRGFTLERHVEGHWMAVDHSWHGNDDWQTDFDPQTQRWELTYSLPLDTPQDERLAHRFRLRRAGA